MLEWLKRNWPFSLAKTVRRMQAAHKEAVERLTASRDAARIQRDQGQIREDRERQRAETAEARGVSFQRQFEQLIRTRNGPEWDYHADKVMRIVDGRDSFVSCVFTAPNLEIDAGPALEYHRQDVVLLRLSFQIGLSEACPPELIAEQMSRKMHDAILTQWAGQSALLQLSEKSR